MEPRADGDGQHHGSSHSPLHQETHNPALHEESSSDEAIDAQIADLEEKKRAKVERRAARVDHLTCELQRKQDEAGKIKLDHEENQKTLWRKTKKLLAVVKKNETSAKQQLVDLEAQLSDLQKRVDTAREAFDMFKARAANIQEDYDYQLQKICRGKDDKLQHNEIERNNVLRQLQRSQEARKMEFASKPQGASPPCSSDGPETAMKQSDMFVQGGNAPVDVGGSGSPGFSAAAESSSGQAAGERGHPEQRTNATSRHYSVTAGDDVHPGTADSIHWPRSHTEQDPTSYVDYSSSGNITPAGGSGALWDSTPVAPVAPMAPVSHNKIFVAPEAESRAENFAASLALEVTRKLPTSQLNEEDVDQTNIQAVDDLMKLVLRHEPGIAAMQESMQESEITGADIGDATTELRQEKPGTKRPQVFGLELQECSLNELFSTIVWLDGRWCEVDCFVCHSNRCVDEERLLRGIRGLIVHIYKCHGSIADRGRAIRLCVKDRTFSSADIEAMRRGEQPEKPFITIHFGKTALRQFKGHPKSSENAVFRDAGAKQVSEQGPSAKLFVATKDSQTHGQDVAPREGGPSPRDDEDTISNYARDGNTAASAKESNLDDPRQPPETPENFKRPLLKPSPHTSRSGYVTRADKPDTSSPQCATSLSSQAAAQGSDIKGMARSDAGSLPKTATKYIQHDLKTTQHATQPIVRLGLEPSQKRKHEAIQGSRKAPNTNSLHPRCPNTAHLNNQWFLIRCAICRANAKHSPQGQQFFRGLLGIQKHAQDVHDHRADLFELEDWCTLSPIKREEVVRINNRLPVKLRNEPYTGDSAPVMHHSRRPSRPAFPTQRGKPEDRTVNPGVALREAFMHPLITIDRNQTPGHSRATTSAIPGQTRAFSAGLARGRRHSDVSNAEILNPFSSPNASRSPARKKLQHQKP